MANLKTIEELAKRIGYREPTWVKGPYTDSDQHLSGRLRSVAEEMLTDKVVADTSGTEYRLKQLLIDAAETLDDAHEDWLQLQANGHALVNDITAICRQKRPVPRNHCGNRSSVRAAFSFRECSQ